MLGTPSSTLGINPVGRVPAYFTSGGEIRVLQSTARTIPDWGGSGAIFNGGGPQWFTHTRGLFIQVP